MNAHPVTLNRSVGQPSRPAMDMRKARCVCPTAQALPTTFIRRRLMRNIAVGIVLLSVSACLCSCQAFGLGKFKGLERTDADEKYYLIKSIFLSGGATLTPRSGFDHNMHDVVCMFFIPSREKGHYVSKTVWYDPMGQEFRTIRQTHDKQEESKSGVERKADGTMRSHCMPVKRLYDHKKGRWKVELYIDDDLARRMTFTVN